MVDISLDIETFAKVPNAAVASIALVAWTEDDPDRVQTFYRPIRDDYDGVYDPETIRWHSEQEGNTLGKIDECVRCEAACIDMSNFLSKFKSRTDGECRIWSHATFDIPVLTNFLIRTFGKSIDLPWHYRNVRDLRTLYDVSGGRPELERVGTYHNALDDALYQMGEIKACFNQMNV